MRTAVPDERGVALAIALLSLVLIGVLLTTTVWVGRQRRDTAVPPARSPDVSVEAQTPADPLDTLTVAGSVDPVSRSMPPASPPGP